MTERRSQGSGSITWLNPGRTKARLRVYTGNDPHTGKPRQASRTITVSGPREANRALDLLKKEVASGHHGGSSVTVAKLLDEWYRQSVSRGRAPKTLHEARWTIDRVLVPEFGSIRAGNLTAHHLDRLYRRLGDEGKKASTIRRYHAVMSAALGQGMKWGWLERNIAAQASPPELREDRKGAISTADVKRLLEAAEAEQPAFAMLLTLAAMTGARRGELCALRWPDVDLDRGLVTIERSLYQAGREKGEKQTKSWRRRQVAVNDKAAGALRRWREICEVVAAEVGRRLVPDAFVVSSYPDGTRPIDPNDLTRYVRVVADRLGLTEVHTHSLRHWAAEELLAATNARDAAEVLGHASPSFTLQRYTHGRTERQRAATDALGAALELPVGTSSE